MQEKGVGQLIRKIREKRNLSQKEVCQGLCSVQKLSSIEAGERIPNVFLFEGILQRVGLSPDDFDTVLFEDEYEEIIWRDTIEAQIENGCYDDATRTLSLHYSGTEKDNLRRQYYYQIKAIVESANNNGKVAINHLAKALLCTCPKLKAGYIDNILLNTKEIELLCMMCDEFAGQGMLEEARKIVEFLLRYVEHNTIQDIELAKTLPKIAYLSNLIQLSKSEQVEIISLCEKAFRLLIDCDSTVFLAEIIEILIQRYSSMHLEKRVVHLQKQLESLKVLYEEFGGCLYVSTSALKWYKEAYRKEYLLCKEIIKGERKAKNISVDTLIFGIYQDAETLIRIENGNQKPSQKKYESIMKKLGLPGEKYHSQRVTEGEEVYQIKKDILHYFTIHDYESAKLELEKLELILGTEDKISEQYLMRQKTMLAFELNQIDAKEFCAQTIEALRKTYAGSIEKPLRIPTLGESEIFNNLAISYWQMGEVDKGIKLFESTIHCYETSKVAKRYHFRSMALLLRNYLRLLEESGKGEHALEIGALAMRIEMSAHRGVALDFICSELMCVYEQMGKENPKMKKAVEKYLRHAFYISDLFMRKMNNQIYDEYYRENIDNSIKWYE